MHAVLFHMTILTATCNAICLQPDLKRRRRSSSESSGKFFEIEVDTANSDHESDCDRDGGDQFSSMGFQEMWEDEVEEPPEQVMQKSRARPPRPRVMVRSVSSDKMDVNAWATLHPPTQARLPLPPPSPAIEDVPVL